MQTERELDLLVDLVKLLKKYDPETFRCLAERITSPEFSQHLSRILEHIAENVQNDPQKKTESKSKCEKTIPKELAKIENKEPEKYQLLMKFYYALVAKSVLPSLRDVKNFAEAYGFPENRSKSRQKAIVPLINSLVKLPHDQLVTIIQSLERYGKNDRSLEGWTRIILNSHRES